MHFKCSICRSLFFDRVIVRRPDGTGYETEFLHCLGCTLVFLEPALMTAALEFKASAPEQLPTMLHEQNSMQRAYFYRYWRARATRERGGAEASPQQANDLIAALRPKTR